MLRFKDGGKEFMQQLGEHEMESPLQHKFYEEEKQGSDNFQLDILKVIIK